MNKNILGLSIFILLAIFGLSISNDQDILPESAPAVSSATIDTLTFSNTMSWDQDLLEIAQKDTVYVFGWQNRISLPAPPKNSSDETKLEIKTLLSYRQQRTPEKIEEIKKQADLDTALLGGAVISDYFDVEKYPISGELLRRTFYDLNIIILNQKEKFNRVRPSVLEPQIAPVLEVPMHPAYPSGHSTQAMFLAHVLGELIPAKRQAIMTEAQMIAKNREIAGLHYPSDTKAGEALAQQYYILLVIDPDFSEMIAEAKKEWQ